MILRCYGCRRAVHFLASDLTDIIDPDHPCHIPPWPCSVCGSGEYVEIQWRSPMPGDIGKLIVRRPGKPRVVRSWREEVL